MSTTQRALASLATAAWLFAIPDHAAALVAPSPPKPAAPASAPKPVAPKPAARTTAAAPKPAAPDSAKAPADATSHVAAELPAARVAEIAAVQEELARGLAGLRLPTAPAPYRAEARWVRAELLSLDGSYGGVITNVMQTQTAGVLELRVGTTQRDDSNFIGTDAGITRFDVPVDPAPEFLRKQLWLALDRAFRGATLAFSQKEVALEQLSTEITVADLGPAAPAGRHVTWSEPVPIDRDGLAAMVASLSARFEDWPAIDNGDVHLQILRSHETVVSSEGQVIVTTHDRAVLAVVADTKAADGMHLDHGLAIHFASVPAADDALLAQGEQLVDKVLRELDELAKAPMIEEEYDGPILLVGSAPAQLLASTVATEASGFPAPLSEGGRLMEVEPDWQSKVGKTVLPPFLDLIDDPGLSGGFGRYAVDAEGFVPRTVTLVDEGVLRDLLLTRVPNPHFGRGSNGRARMTPALEVGPALSNLTLRSRKRGLPAASLERELLSRAREDGYDFAYVIESLRDGTVLGPVIRQSGSAYAGTGKITLPLPGRVHRIDASGTRTLVRGVVLAPASMRALRRIRAVGQSDRIERLRLPVGAFGGFASEVGMDGILSQTVDVQIAAPDLLVDGLELLVERGEHERLPILPHPLRRPAPAPPDPEAATPE